MTYDHMVKVNGKYYQTGEEVPNIKNMAMDTSSLPYSDSEIEFESQKYRQYTKTDINGMSTAELQNLAAEEGIENAYETSGRELKKVLIEHFGL